MDNNWLLFFLGLIASIPLGIFVNLATPWVKSYFRNSSLSIRERRINIIIDHYSYINRLVTNPEFRFFRLIRSLAILIAVCILSAYWLGIGIGVFSDFFNLVENKFVQGSWVFLLVLIFLLGFYAFLDMKSDIEKAISFTKYKEDTIAKLRKLGVGSEAIKELFNIIENKDKK